ncbi:MAG: sigma-70 family RNA polymerase sigma factor [Lachnospiraceae bacterium]
MKLTLQQKEIVRKKFCTYCIKVLHGEALNYLDEMKRLREREVTFSELIPDEWNQLCTYDDFLEKESFQVLGMNVPINDADISAALKKLPEKKRRIILMLYFLDMTEEEIAECLQLVQSTVHYHKADSLRLLRKILITRGLNL